DALLAGAGELVVVLGEVAGTGLVAPLDGASLGLHLAHGDLQERRLADAVGADDRQAVAALHLERDVRQARPAAVGLRDPFQSQHLAAAGADLLELESGVAARALA